MTRILPLVCLTVAGMMLAAGCSAGGQQPAKVAASPHHERSTQRSTTPAPLAIAPAPAVAASQSSSPRKPYHFDGHGANVSRARFGKAWPLTVDSGRVNCLPTAGPATIVVFTDDDGTYPLNGTATEYGPSIGLHLRPIRSIWAKNPDVPGLRKDISVLTDVCAPLMS